MKSPSHGRKIIAEVAKDFGMTVQQMLQESREPDFVRARRAAMVRLKRKMYTLQAIGELMQGDRPKPMHHSTVLHHLEKAGFK